MIASVPAQVSSTAGSAPVLPGKAIPFAQAPAVSAGSAGFAIVVTLALLALIALGLWFARRHGWLRPWLGSRELFGQVDELKVVTRVRLSSTARAMVLEHEGERFLVVESSQHLVMHPHLLASEGDGSSHA